MTYSMRLSTACLAMAMTGGAILAYAGADSMLSSDDSAFLKKAAKGGMAEVELGKLASELDFIHQAA
jgi:predicted outer membrane protein